MSRRRTARRRRPATTNAVSRVVSRYRKALIDDSLAFTHASLAQAQARISGTGDEPFNEMTVASMRR